MDFIIGGAYQGKLSVAQEKFGVTDNDVFDCKNCLNINDDKYEIDFSKRCIYNVEKFVLYCVKNQIEAKDYFVLHEDMWKDSVIICEDIFCGVVPIDSELRAWREMTGRLSIYLSSKASSVTRVFCGLEQSLK